jgi:FkbM family methyltransferase
MHLEQPLSNDYGVDPSMVGVTKRIAVYALDVLSYRVFRSSALPFGVDYLTDIRRLSAALSVPIRTFFDVGANEGSTSRAALKMFREAKVIAFEPHPSTFAKLADSQRSPRFTAVNVAMSDAPGHRDFFDYGAAHSSINSLLPNAKYVTTFESPTPSVIRVCASTIDSFCAENEVTPSVIKIDTEGHELAVIRGARHTLASGALAFVYVEFNDLLGTQSPAALLPIAENLDEFGFRFVASYTDYIVPEREFVVANALFVRAMRPRAHSG